MQLNAPHLYFLSYTRLCACIFSDSDTLLDVGTDRGSTMQWIWTQEKWTVSVLRSMYLAACVALQLAAVRGE